MRGTDGAGGTGAGALTRRSVVRAGVAAAWTAPLVQVMAAAPAQAVGSGVTLSWVSGAFSHASSNRDFKFTGSLKNNGTQTTAALQITVVLTTNGTTSWTGAVVQSTPAGFSASSPSLGGSSGAWTVTVTFTRSTQLAAGASVTFNPTIRCDTAVQDQSGSGTATATATGASPAATGNAYTA